MLKEICESNGGQNARYIETNTIMSLFHAPNLEERAERLDCGQELVCTLTPFFKLRAARTQTLLRYAD